MQDNSRKCTTLTSRRNEKINQDFCCIAVHCHGLEVEYHLNVVCAANKQGVKSGHGMVTDDDINIKSSAYMMHDIHHRLKQELLATALLMTRSTYHLGTASYTIVKFGLNNTDSD